MSTFEVPDGFVVVPREPTEAMLARFRGLTRCRDTVSRARMDWEYMIARAPPYQQASMGGSEPKTTPINAEAHTPAQPNRGN